MAAQTVLQSASSAPTTHFTADSSAASPSIIATKPTRRMALATASLWPCLLPLHLLTVLKGSSVVPESLEVRHLCDPPKSFQAAAMPMVSRMKLVARRELNLDSDSGGTEGASF